MGARSSLHNFMLRLKHACNGCCLSATNDKQVNVNVGQSAIFCIEIGLLITGHLSPFLLSLAREARMCLLKALGRMKSYGGDKQPFLDKILRNCFPSDLVARWINLTPISLQFFLSSFPLSNPYPSRSGRAQ